MPVAGTCDAIIIKSLAPGRLKCSGASIQVQLLHQLLRAIACLQETGTALRADTEADNPNHFSGRIQRRAAAIAMFHVAAHLNEGRARIRRLDRTDINGIYRRGKQVGRCCTHISIARKTNDSELILHLNAG